MSRRASLALLLIATLFAGASCKQSSSAKLLGDGDAVGGGDPCEVAGQKLEPAACRGYETIRGKRRAGANGWDWDVSGAQLANPQAFDWRGIAQAYQKLGGGSVGTDYTKVAEADKARVWAWFNERYGFIGDTSYDPSGLPFGITVNTSEKLGRQQTPSAANPWFHMNCLTCHLGEAKNAAGATTAWMGLPNYRIKWPQLWQELPQFNDLPDLADPRALLRRAQHKFDTVVRDIIGTPPSGIKEYALYVKKIPDVLRRLREHVSKIRGLRIADLFAKGEALEDFFAKFVFSLYFRDKAWAPGQSPAAFIGYFGLKGRDLSPNGNFDADYPNLMKDFFPNRNDLIEWGEKEFKFRGKRLFGIPYIRGLNLDALRPVLAYKEYVIPDNVLPWYWSRLTPGHFTEQIFIKRRSPDVRPLLNGSFFFTEPNGASLTSRAFVDRMAAIQTLVDAVQLPPVPDFSDAEVEKARAGAQVFEARCGRCHDSLSINPSDVQPGVGSEPAKNFRDVGTNPDLSIMYQVSAGITANIPYFTKQGFTDVVRKPDPKDKGRYRAQPLIAPWIRQRIFHDASVTYDDLLSGTYQGAGHNFLTRVSADDRDKLKSYLKLRCVKSMPADGTEGSFGILTGADYAKDCGDGRAAARTEPSAAPEGANLLDSGSTGEPAATQEGSTGSGSSGSGSAGSGGSGSEGPAAEPADADGPERTDEPDTLGPDPADDNAELFNEWIDDFCATEGVQCKSDPDAGLEAAGDAETSGGAERSGAPESSGATP